MNRRKIAVAMSGGVDSSVVAALLAQEYGKENVFGITMRLFCYNKKNLGSKSCCSLMAINDAKLVCKKLGIKHYVLDFEKEFEREVIDNFVSEYLRGRTPNPCIRCNSIIKFDYLLKKAKGLGGDFLATGHYARVLTEQLTINDKRLTKYRLMKGLDKKKDQSYFLYGLTQEQLKHTLFPLGSYNKREVRKLAKEFGLKTAEKTESQEICFIDTNYHEFLKDRLIQIKGGEIVDKDGNILGGHRGLPFYTIGQRRRIGIAKGTPLYVIGMDVRANRLIVGKEKDLYRREFDVNEVNWISGKPPAKEFKAGVMIRYNMVPQKAYIFVGRKGLKVIFDQPQKAITPGQSAVLYLKEEVVGGGVIRSVVS